MIPLSRRELFLAGIAATLGVTGAAASSPVDLHQELLDLAARLEKERRARFHAIRSPDELESLQASLRKTFLRLLGGLPEAREVPAATITGRIEEEDYSIEKLVFESFPNYFVSALLYRPKKASGRVPGVLSPCGHSAIGKAQKEYQILHANLAKRGFVVLAYDPVGQGERSQFWDTSKRKTRFNLGCGEHAVIGNAVYLLGSNLARFRIWDGIRALDYLASLPEVDATKLGCAGNSGGGNLTAYITALEPRITAAAPCCYITTLPRRMGNRIQEDPSADPEQDIFGFVSEGIDHAGLLALCAPRPTMIGAATRDFFPIEGTRESFAEAKRLYELSGAGDRITLVEAPGKHGLSLVLREAVYRWFDHWLRGRDPAATEAEYPLATRSADELRVCAEGQVNVTFRSRPLLPMALEEFRARPKPARKALREILGIDLAAADPSIEKLAAGSTDTLVVCVNGNEEREWREEREFLRAIERAGHEIAVVDPRGVGSRRLRLTVAGAEYCDPLSGVEENVAYNAFLVGQSLMGLRVADVVAAVRKLGSEKRGRRVILCGRRDAALAACFAAAIEESIGAVATEGMLASMLPLFSADGLPTNAAQIVPGLLRDFGDVPDVLAQVAPRRVLLSASRDGTGRDAPHLRVAQEAFTRDPQMLIQWMNR